MFSFVLLSVVLLAGPRAAGQAQSPPPPADVPAGHWAYMHVANVVNRRVMATPNGRFNGNARVSRQEMAITLARLARSLEQGRWPSAGASPTRAASGRPSPSPGARPITRYELAAAIDKVARYAAQGLPKSGGKVYGTSVVLPPPSTVRAPRTDPAYASLVYLTRNRLLWRPSPILTSGSQPVTAAQAADALAMLVVGLNDRRTDEPELKQDLGEPPAKPGAPARPGASSTRPSVIP